MTTARKAEQIVVEAPNRVGLLAEHTTALLGAGVNIVAIMGHGRGLSAELVIVTDDNERAVEALKKTGASVRLQQVVLLTMPDEVGALNEAARRVSEAGIDIGWMYATAGDCVQVTVVLATADVDKVVALF